MYKNNRCNSNFKKRNLYVKNGFKNRENTGHKNTANIPVMNVGNSPQLVCMDRLFHILPGIVKNKTGAYLVQSGYSDFHR